MLLLKKILSEFNHKHQYGLYAHGFCVKRFFVCVFGYKGNYPKNTNKTKWKAIKLAISTKVIFQIVALNPIGFNERFSFYSSFSRRYVSTNSAAPLSPYKPTHDPQFLHFL